MIAKLTDRILIYKVYGLGQTCILYIENTKHNNNT